MQLKFQYVHTTTECDSIVLPMKWANGLYSLNHQSVNQSVNPSHNLSRPPSVSLFLPSLPPTTPLSLSLPPLPSSMWTGMEQ